MARGYNFWKSKLAIAALGNLCGLLLVLWGLATPFMTEAPPRGMKRLPHDPHWGQALAFLTVGGGIGLASTRFMLRTWQGRRECR